MPDLEVDQWYRTPAYQKSHKLSINKVDAVCGAPMVYPTEWNRYADSVPWDVDYFSIRVDERKPKDGSNKCTQCKKGGFPERYFTETSTFTAPVKEGETVKVDSVSKVSAPSPSQADHVTQARFNSRVVQIIQLFRAENLTVVLE